jgi:polyhydroxybutyrate depolymerase
MGYRYLVLMSLLLSTTFLVTDCRVYSAQAVLTGDQRGGISVFGLKRTYLLHISPTYSGQTAVPLVIVLHGTSKRGTDAAKITGFSAIADREGFIIVYPDSLTLDKTLRWVIRDTEGHYDVAFIQALIDKLQETLNIDSRRIYVTGMSNGGYFTYVLACTLPGKFAAIATVIGGMERTVVHHCQVASPLAVLMINGTADLDVPMVGSTLTLSTDDIRDFWLKADSCFGDPVSTSLPDNAPTDGTTTLKKVWIYCRADAEIVQYIVQGGEHAWPGYDNPTLKETCEQLKRCPTLDFSASEEIWTFFSRHSL